MLRAVREPEIQHADGTVLRRQHVVGMHVAVDHAARVQLGVGAQHGDAQRQEPSGTLAPALGPQLARERRRRHALAPFQQQVWPARLLAGFDQPRCGAAGEMAQQQRLALHGRAHGIGMTGAGELECRDPACGVAHPMHLGVLDDMRRAFDRPSRVALAGLEAGADTLRPVGCGRDQDAGRDQVPQQRECRFERLLRIECPRLAERQHRVHDRLRRPEALKQFGRVRIDEL